MRTLLAIGTIFCSLNVYAAKPALECVNDRGDIKASYTVTGPKTIKIEETRTVIKIGDTQPTEIKSPAFSLELLGKASIKKKFGILVKRDPVLAFVSFNDPGQAYANISLVPETDGRIAAEFVVNLGLGSMYCKKGKGYDNLKKMASKAPAASKQEVDDYSDADLAFRCVSQRNQHYVIRAMGSITYLATQIIQEDPYKRLDFESYTDDRSSVTFTESDAKTIPALTLMKNSHVVGGEKIYDATLNDGVAKVALKCEERWAMSTIWDAL